MCICKTVQLEHLVKVGYLPNSSIPQATVSFSIRELVQINGNFGCTNDELWEKYKWKQPFTSELPKKYINIFILDFMNSHIKDI